jgi:hypothetical protein
LSRGFWVSAGVLKLTHATNKTPQKYDN